MAGHSQLIQWWKTPHIVKGCLSYVPVLQKWRTRRALSGGTNQGQYCYKVWLNHLSSLADAGFDVRGAHMVELGPGDSIGTGLAGLLSGADAYRGLDAIPYSANVDLPAMLSELVQMFSSRTPIRPGSDFPDAAVDWVTFPRKVEQLRVDAQSRMTGSRHFSYKAPWRSSDVEPESVDLVFSDGVLHHMDDLPFLYRTTFSWLKSGGYCSHAIPFSAAYLSPFWNGHWAYADWQWRLVRGRRPFPPTNREPVSAHLRCAQDAGFEIASVSRAYYANGLATDSLAPRFRALDPEDLRTSRATIVLRKPAVADGRHVRGAEIH